MLNFQEIQAIAEKVVNGDIEASEVIDQIVDTAKALNDQYAKGDPDFNDNEYDAVIAFIEEYDPENKFILDLEARNMDGKTVVVHDVPMLSIDKTFEGSGVKGWLRKVERSATKTGVKAEFRVTPKLDGIAGGRKGNQLATRGRDGLKGFDISGALTLGVLSSGNNGLGEVVMKQVYFDEVLAPKGFKHPRNAVAGMCNAISNGSKVNAGMTQAVKDKAVYFYDYASLNSWTGDSGFLSGNIEMIQKRVLNKCPFPCDGVIIEVTNPEIRADMGKGSKTANWNLALKTREPGVETTIIDIIEQVGRTGVVTPVAILDPVFVHGAVLSRVTLHHVQGAIDAETGPGSVVEVARNGLVVPGIVNVVEKVSYHPPTQCPCCSSDLEKDGPRLRCEDPECEAQASRSIQHFFKTLGVLNFGGKACIKIVDGGYTRPVDVMSMTKDDFVRIGFGQGEAKRLIDSVEAVISEPMPDWKLLASFGIRNLGRGDSKKILAHHPIETLHELTQPRLKSIYGFDKTSHTIVKEIQRRWNSAISPIVNSGRWNILQDSIPKTGTLEGSSIVFTGKLSASRTDMQSIAREFGAEAKSSVSGNTTYLVCGERTGATKVAKAEKNGTECITEEEFHGLCKGQTLDQLRGTSPDGPGM